ncbi:MAG TPA: LysR family transcriptional regulator [Fontimonas sp.]
MELRHLRCFRAVAEELSFARAAERLHIEQSPLSRTIKELEEDLGAQLFVRTTRSTRLTRAGMLLLEHVPRVFAAFQQAREAAQAGANGCEAQLRIALSDGITLSRLPVLLARCREEDPEVDFRLYEVPLAQQLKGLQDDQYDVGFAQSDEVGEHLLAEPAWREPLVVAVPAGHELASLARIPLDELLRYPLVLCDPQVCEGHARQVERALRAADLDPLVVDRVASFELMMTLVAAGFALGLAGASQLAAIGHAGVLARPIAGRSPMLTTYLLRSARAPSQVLSRFVERVANLDARESTGGMVATTPVSPEEIAS